MFDFLLNGAVIDVASQKILAFRDDIKVIIDKWDPVDILRFSKDEYQDNVDEIVDKISVSSEVASIAKVINRTFKKRYGPEYEKTLIDCIDIANKIYNLLKK
jgi:hypothetical protein